MNKTLMEYGYPSEGIIEVDAGGGDSYESPQERWSARTCGSCKCFNGTYCTKDWNNMDESYCVPERDEKDPDNDTCEDIDYEEEWLNELREPVRCEYSSDETYEQACKAINAINRDIEAEFEHRFNIRQYGRNYWKDEWEED